MSTVGDRRTPAPSETGGPPRPRPTPTRPIPQDVDMDSDDEDDKKPNKFYTAKPDMFTGERQKLDDWLTQMKLYFIFNKVPSDRQALFAATYLRGQAQHWVKPYLGRFFTGDRDLELKAMFEDFVNFESQMRHIFGVSNELSTAIRVIQGLKQKTSASDYAAKFTEYSQITKWGNDALMEMFKRGLKESVKDELMRVSHGQNIDTLEQLITTSIEVDDKLYERAMDKRRNFNIGNINTGHYGNRKYSKTNNYGDPMDLSVTTPVRKKGPGPKKGSRKDAGKLTCYACGKPGHMARDCRSKGHQGNVQPRQFNAVARTVQFNMITRRDKAIKHKRLGIMENIRDVIINLQRENEKVLITRPWNDELARKSEKLKHTHELLSNTWAGLKDEHQLGTVTDNGLTPANQHLELESHEKRPWILCHDDQCSDHYHEKDSYQFFPQKEQTLTGLKKIVEEFHKDARDDLNHELTKANSAAEYVAHYQEREFSLWKIILLLRAAEKGDDDDGTVTTLAFTKKTPVYMGDVCIEDSGEEETSTEESEDDEEDGSVKTGRMVTFEVDTPGPLQELIILLGQSVNIIFPMVNGERKLDTLKFDSMLDTFRRKVWDWPQIYTPIDLYNTIKDVPPIGVRFLADGGYDCGNGVVVTRSMRETIIKLRQKFKDEQERQILARDLQQQQVMRHEQYHRERYYAQSDSGKGKTPVRGALTGSAMPLRLQSQQFSAHK